MANVTLSNAVRNNLLSLQKTAVQLGKTQERLASGLKVNSALDDPTAFFTASSLNSRASDLNRLLDSVSNAVQTIKAADQGISAITKLVENAQAIARQALQKPAQTQATASGAEGAVDLNTTTNLVLAATETATLDINGTTLAVTDTTTVQDVLDFVNTSVTDVSAAVVASGTNGAIQLTGANGQAVDVTITGTNAAAFTTATGLADATDGTAANNADRATLETQFNALRSQIDQLAADASFNGNNLLNGDSLTVIFNENNTSSLSITGVTFDAAGLGVSAAATDSFQSNTLINTTLGELDTAISTLRQQAATFGSNLSIVEVRQDFTKNLINTLETGAANLTLADTNEEGANMLALQTRQQLSSVALSLASQADQNVLRLF